MGEYAGPEAGYKSIGLSQGNHGLVMPDPNATKVVFMSKPKLMPAQSKEQGRQIWENVTYVRVHPPGDKYPIELEAHAGHFQRWAREYEAFLAGKQVMPEGTPLNILLPGNEAGVNELNSLGIFTIEQMAGIADSVLHRVPFGMDMKNRAKRYIEAQNGAQGFNKVQGELDKANAKVADMERKFEELQAQMSSMSQAPAATPDITAIVAAAVAAQMGEKRGPGRPRKEEAA